MTPDRYQQVGQIYRQVSEIPAERRAQFLEVACGADDKLRHEVELLLVHQSASPGWIDGRALDVVAEAVATTQAGSWLNRQVGHYQIVSLLNTGGMGE